MSETFTRHTAFHISRMLFLKCLFNSYVFVFFVCFADIRWCSEEAMGSCLSCPEKESIPDNHQSKFKVSSCLCLLRQRPQSQEESVNTHPGLFTNDCGRDISQTLLITLSQSPKVFFIFFCSFSQSFTSTGTNVFTLSHFALHAVTPT